MGLGRTTRFAPLPAGARRVSVMRSGTGGLKVLAPSPALIRDFMERKRALLRAGRPTDEAHAEAARLVDYRRRYLGEIRGSPEAMRALRDVVAEARTRDVYLMCMCPYRTREEACHTYLLLDLARQLAARLRLLAEPRPDRGARPPGGDAEESARRASGAPPRQASPGAGRAARRSPPPRMDPKRRG